MDVLKALRHAHIHNEEFFQLLNPAPYLHQVTQQSFLQLHLLKHYYVKRLKLFFLVLHKFWLSVTWYMFFRYPAVPILPQYYLAPVYVKLLVALLLLWKYLQLLIALDPVPKEQLQFYV